MKQTPYGFKPKDTAIERPPRRRSEMESALRNAVLACRPDASMSVVGGKHNLVLTVVVPWPEDSV